MEEEGDVGRGRPHGVELKQVKALDHAHTPLPKLSEARRREVHRL